MISREVILSRTDTTYEQRFGRHEYTREVLLFTDSWRILFPGWRPVSAHGPWLTFRERRNGQERETQGKHPQWAASEWQLGVTP